MDYSRDETPSILCKSEHWLINEAYILYAQFAVINQDNMLD